MQEFAFGSSHNRGLACWTTMEKSIPTPSIRGICEILG
jgi:hypothetical protein